MLAGKELSGKTLLSHPNKSPKARPRTETQAEAATGSIAASPDPTFTMRNNCGGAAKPRTKFKVCDFAETG